MKGGTMKEKDLYPKIQQCLESPPYNLITKNPNARWQKWREIGFIGAGLVKTAGTKGLIADILALRQDVDPYGFTRLEIWAVEVKPELPKYKLYHMNQAKGASLFAHRIYLAAPRKFTQQEKETALELKIGLFYYDTANADLQEVVPSPINTPDSKHTFRVLVNLGYRLCSICNRWYPETETQWTRIKSPSKFWVEPNSNRDLCIYICQGCRDIIREIAQS
jgi:hypothetical protein